MGAMYLVRQSSFICLCATLLTLTALAQPAAEGPTANPEITTASSPSAWVYVVSYGNSGSSSIMAYQSAADGRLTTVPGSPFANFDTNEIGIAVNGKYLFVTDEPQESIDAYTIESDGSLTYSATTHVPSEAGGCGHIGSPFLDHTGASLYVIDWADQLCSDWLLLGFAVDKSNGDLTFLDSAGNGQIFTVQPLSFLGNNKFAYGSEGWGTETVVGFERKRKGSLSALNIHPAMPKPAKGLHYNVWSPVAADPQGNLAIAVQARDSSGKVVGDTQLAVYSADGSGRLTTTSTYANMPNSLTGPVASMSMSPSGKLLAVAGVNGLQIFHFNGAKPITSYTKLQDYHGEFEPMFGDNDDHLYAINQASNQLWVFTVTPTKFSVAPGSPYSVSGPISLSVQPLPRY